MIIDELTAAAVYSILPDAKFHIENMADIVWEDDRDMPTEQDIANAVIQLKIKGSENMFTEAIDEYIGSVAKSNGYTNIISVRSYTGFDNPFQQDCTKLAKWSADCWVKAGEIKDDVLAGNRAMPTVEQVIAEMPVYQ